MDWADIKAREWLARAVIDAKRRIPVGLAQGATREASLAALLREVANEQIDRQVAMMGKDVEETWASGSEFAREQTLAEVRVIVMNASAAGPQSWLDVRDEILARLEALK